MPTLANLITEYGNSLTRIEVESLMEEAEKQRRMKSEMAALFAYLDDTREKWGEKVVYQWIDEWFIREINND